MSISNGPARRAGASSCRADRSRVALAAFCVGAALAGCGHGAEPAPSAASSVQSPPVQPSAMYVVALQSAEPNPVHRPPAGCDQISLSGSPGATGTVERVPAPDIAGITTTGVKLTIGDPQDDPDYLYTAALDDRTAVVVMGGADAQLDPPKLLSDLLVKAVSAVRGQ